MKPTDKQKELWKNLYEWRSPDGDSMAVDEVCLFLNNSTIGYAGGLYKQGQSKEQYLEALLEGGFSQEIATVVAKKLYSDLKFMHERMPRPVEV